MPAVDLDRLARQIDALLTEAADTEALGRGSLDLLELYRSRSRRSPGAQRVAPRPGGLGAPRPVVRALAQALRRAMRGRPNEALVLAAWLWHRESWETRTLAIELLADVADDEAAAWAEPRAADCSDLDLLDALCSRGLCRWRQEHPQAFLRSAARWLSSESAPLRAMAYLALRAEAEDTGSESIPAILRLLPASLSGTRGLARAALVRLLHSLARHSPHETARLLHDWLDSGRVEAADLVRAVLPAFPAAQQTILREALAESRPAGIIQRTL